MYHRDSQPMSVPGKWSMAEATRRIRQCAADRRFSLHIKDFVLGDELQKRNLIVGDVLYVLRNGQVRDEPTPSDVIGFFRYRMCGRTPSNRRTLVVTVVPARSEMKVMDVKWKSEL